MPPRVPIWNKRRPVNNVLRRIFLRPVNYSWSCASLQSGLVIGAAYWLQTPRSSGAAVVALGVLAVLKAVRAEDKWSQIERAGWLILLAIIALVAIRANNEENRERNQQFLSVQDQQLRGFDRTMSGVEDSIKTQTGGNSFAFLSFTAQQAASFEMHWNNFVAPIGVPYFLVSITSRGKYPLRNAHAILMDDERRIAAMQEYNRHPKGDWIHVIDSADTEYQIPYLRPQSPESPSGEVDIVGLYPVPQANSKRLTINFSAPNGYWNESLHLGRVNGVWHECLSVIGPTIEQNKHPFIYCGTSDWREGENLAQKDWGFTKPASPAP